MNSKIEINNQLRIGIEYMKLHEKAFDPFQAHPTDAGMDLKSCEDYTIDPGNTVFVHTGLSFALPEGTFGGIFARSGLACKQGLRPANCVGVIDSDYRGEVIVALYNDSSERRFVKAGDRVAQMIILPVLLPKLQCVDQLTSTERGEGGFGSTGI